MYVDQSNLGWEIIKLLMALAVMGGTAWAMIEAWAAIDRGDFNRPDGDE